MPGGVFIQAGAGVKTNLPFFTKGTPTEKIWYYDLSDIKVGKKTPLTLDKFDEFFRLLPERADSEHSWTVDLKARRAEAKRQADPLCAQAQPLSTEAEELREQIKILKKQNVSDQQARISKLAEKAVDLESQAKELKAKAQSIEDAVYDLKAVNPNVKNEEDTQTPDELLDLIEIKGREVAEVLASLHNATVIG